MDMIPFEVLATVFYVVVSFIVLASWVILSLVTYMAFKNNDTFEQRNGTKILKTCFALAFISIVWILYHFIWHLSYR